MSDRIIAGGDYQRRAQHFAALGWNPHEIGRILNLSCEQVIVLLRATDDREQYTTSNS